MALELPAWLSASFPSREFKTFRRCKLRKDADPEVGAGLILEANEFGASGRGLGSTVVPF